MHQHQHQHQHPAHPYPYAQQQATMLSYSPPSQLGYPAYHHGHNHSHAHPSHAHPHGIIMTAGHPVLAATPMNSGAVTVATAAQVLPVSTAPSSNGHNHTHHGQYLPRIGGVGVGVPGVLPALTMNPQSTSTSSASDNNSQSQGPLQLQAQSSDFTANHSLSHSHSASHGHNQNVSHAMNHGHGGVGTSHSHSHSHSIGKDDDMDEENDNDDGDNDNDGDADMDDDDDNNTAGNDEETDDDEDGDDDDNEKQSNASPRSTPPLSNNNASVVSSSSSSASSSSSISSSNPSHSNSHSGSSVSSGSGSSASSGSASAQRKRVTRANAKPTLPVSANGNISFAIDEILHSLLSDSDLPKVVEQARHKADSWTQAYFSNNGDSNNNFAIPFQSFLLLAMWRFQGQYHSIVEWGQVMERCFPDAYRIFMASKGKKGWHYSSTNLLSSPTKRKRFNQRMENEGLSIDLKEDKEIKASSNRRLYSVCTYALLYDAEKRKAAMSQMAFAGGAGAVAAANAAAGVLDDDDEDDEETPHTAATMSTVSTGSTTNANANTNTNTTNTSSGPASTTTSTGASTSSSKKKIHRSSLPTPIASSNASALPLLQPAGSPEPPLSAQPRWVSDGVKMEENSQTQSAGITMATLAVQQAHAPAAQVALAALSTSTLPPSFPSSGAALPGGASASMDLSSASASASSASGASGVGVGDGFNSQFSPQFGAAGNLPIVTTIRPSPPNAPPIVSQAQDKFNNYLDRVSKAMDDTAVRMIMIPFTSVLTVALWRNFGQWKSLHQWCDEMATMCARAYACYPVPEKESAKFNQDDPQAMAERVADAWRKASSHPLRNTNVDKTNQKLGKDGLIVHQEVILGSRYFNLYFSNEKPQPPKIEPPPMPNRPAAGFITRATSEDTEVDEHDEEDVGGRPRLSQGRSSPAMNMNAASSRQALSQLPASIAASLDKVSSFIRIACTAAQIGPSNVPTVPFRSLFLITLYSRVGEYKSIAKWADIMATEFPIAFQLYAASTGTSKDRRRRQEEDDEDDKASGKANQRSWRYASAGLLCSSAKRDEANQKLQREGLNIDFRDEYPEGNAADPQTQAQMNSAMNRSAHRVFGLRADHLEQHRAGSAALAVAMASLSALARENVAARVAAFYPADRVAAGGRPPSSPGPDSFGFDERGQHQYQHPHQHQHTHSVSASTVLNSAGHPHSQSIHQRIYELEAEKRDLTNKLELMEKRLEERSAEDIASEIARLEEKKSWERVNDELKSLQSQFQKADSERRTLERSYQTQKSVVEKMVDNLKAENDKETVGRSAQDLQRDVLVLRTERFGWEQRIEQERNEWKAKLDNERDHYHTLLNEKNELQKRILKYEERIEMFTDFMAKLRKEKEEHMLALKLLQKQTDELKEEYRVKEERDKEKEKEKERDKENRDKEKEKEREKEKDNENAMIVERSKIQQTPQMQMTTPMATKRRDQAPLPIALSTPISSQTLNSHSQPLAALSLGAAAHAASVLAAAAQPTPTGMTMPMTNTAPVQMGMTTPTLISAAPTSSSVAASVSAPFSVSGSANSGVNVSPRGQKRRTQEMERHSRSNSNTPPNEFTAHASSSSAAKRVKVEEGSNTTPSTSNPNSMPLDDLVAPTLNRMQMSNNNSALADDDDIPPLVAK